MKALAYYLGHKEFYFISAISGTSFATLFTFLKENTPEQIFGLSLSIWVILLVINLFDNHSGIKAHKKICQIEGEKFTFKSGKGWRFPEKIGLFTIVIGFCYHFEKEAILYDFPSYISILFTWFKFAFSFYIGLLEFQSIGENREVIYSKKEKPFHLLDKIIIAIDDGFIAKIKSFFYSNNQ